MEPEYDFVIIGSGMGGLASGVILAKEGYSVLILEKNHQVGGSLQVFSREKCVFDTGVHYVGGLDEGENLNKFFRYLGIMDDLNIRRLDDECYDLIVFPDGKEYCHGSGYELFKKGLYEAFPEEKAAIDQFCEKVIDMCRYFPLYNIQPAEDNAYFNQPEILELNAYEVICSLTENERLRNVLAGSAPLYAGKKEQTPFYVMALITNSFIKGSYRFTDGGSQIAIALSKQLRAHGGNLLKHKEVNGATYDKQGNILSVETTDGSSYRAKRFISNLHPEQTIDVFDESRFLNAYKSRIRKLENTVSSFMVYLVFHQDMFPYMNYNTYLYGIDDVWETVDYNSADWPEMIFISTHATSKQDRFSDGMSVMAYMNYSEVEQWSETFNTVAQKSKRGEAYETFKKQKEELVILALEKRFPYIRKAIKNVYSSTPLTYKDYIGTKDGSLYGILKDANNVAAGTINPKTRIPNLYLTGQNLVFHGVLGATIGAFITSFLFTDQSSLLNKINHED